MQSPSSSCGWKIGFGLVLLALLSAEVPPAHATVDQDGDGYLQGGDCDDTDDSVWSIPGEAEDLQFTSKTTLVWRWAQDRGGIPSSVRSDLLRASSPIAFPLIGSCSTPDITVTTATDTSVPASGQAFFYLARSRNACGDGSLGTRSDGTPRAGASCDCSAICDDGQACTADRCASGACVHDPLVTAIQDQPQGVAVCPGGSATFRVRGVPDGSTQHYQWKKNGSNVGTDSPTLSLSGLALADDGAQITCVVTGACAGTTTQTAILTVFPSAASCAGGGTGQGAPNGASTIAEDPASDLTGIGRVNTLVVLDGTRSNDDEVIRTYTWSGELRIDRSDLEIAGRGFDFTWDTTYLSRAERLTPMGWNWDFTYNRYVTVAPGGALYVYGGDGRRDLYTPSPLGCHTSPGLFRDLCPQPDGSLVLTFEDRSTWTFAPLDGSPAQGKWLQTRDTWSNAMHATYDPAGRLTAITDTLGRPITISYDADGYIAAVSDFGGRAVTYGRYLVSDSDGMPGDLKSVTSPHVTDTPNGGDFPDGKTTTYVYTKNTGQPALDHALREARHPSNQEGYTSFLRATYTPTTNPSDASFDRVQKLVYGDDPFTSIAYVYAPAVPGEEDPAVTKAIVRDRAGNVRETYFDAGNRVVALREYTGRAPNTQIPTGPSTNRPINPLRATDPPYFRTRFTWNSDSLLTEVTFPELDKIQFTYDSANPDVHLRGNLLQRKRLPGPRGADQPSTTETWTYTTAFGDGPCYRGDCREMSDYARRNLAYARVKVKFPSMPSDSGGSYWARSAYPGDKTPIVRGSALGGLGRVGIGWDWLLPDDGIVGWDWLLPDDGIIGASDWGVGDWAIFASSRRYQQKSAHSYTDALGRTYTRNIDPATGAVLQVSAPPVMTGVWGSSTQDIAVSRVYNSHGQLVQQTGPTGRVDTMTYASSGPAAGYLDSVTIDDVGTLPGDHHALHTVIARDQHGNPTAITDPRGHTETFVVNQLDQVVRHVSKPPFSYVTDLRYDGRNLLVRVEEPNLDETGTARTRPRIATLFGHDPLKRPAYVVLDGRASQDPEGGLNARTEFVYEPGGGLTLTRLPEAVAGHQPTNTVRAIYDERGRRFRVTRAESDPGASTTQYDYDGDGNVVTVSEGIESSPRIWASHWDGYNRLVTLTDPMGNVSTLHYDANDNAVSSRVDGEMVDGESGPNVRLSESSTTHDEIGRPVLVERAFFDPATGMPVGDGYSTARTYYDADSRVSHVQDDHGHVTTLTYDSARRLDTTTSPTGNSHQYTYDENGNVVALTETELSALPGLPPDVTVTTATYDALGRTTSTTQGGVAHQFAWDSRSPGPVVHLDGRGNETRVVHDAMGNSTSTQRKLLDTGEAGGNEVGVIETSAAYDLDSRLVSQTDDNGNATVTAYDALGRAVAMSYADGTVETTTYSVHDNPLFEERKNGTVIAADFDYKDRLRTRTMTLGPNVMGPTFEVYKYDGLSRVVYAQNNTTHVVLSYDSLSNVSQEVSGGTSIPDLTLTRVHDGEGICTSLTYPSGLTVATAINGEDRREYITATGPGVCSSGPPPHAFCKTPADCGGGACVPMPPVVTTYQYTGSRVTHRANGNGTDTTIAYDGLRRVSHMTHARISPYAVIDDSTYTWDAMDNKASRVTVNGSGAGTSNGYGYDSANRLIHSVETPPPGTPPTTIDYAFDGAGNRLYVVGGLDAGAYTMSSGLPEPADHQANQYTTTPFDAREYDRSGSLLATPSMNLRYDYRGRLVFVSGSVGSASFTFDALGRRVIANGRRYVYNGMQEIEERTPTGTLRRASVYGNGIDEILSVAADVDLDGNPDRTFYHADDLDDVTAVTSAAGAVLETYDYADYGKPRFFGPTGVSLSASAIGNPILFNGRRYDALIGLYDYRTRSMDPRSGRFISADSIGAWGDDSSLGNTFTYAGNNPRSGTDPTGTAKVPRSVLKEYFQTGDKPTQAQFGALIDSMINRIADLDLLGLTSGKVPRSVLKEYFQTGDKPTQAQFGALIDSMLNRIDDRDLLGLTSGKVPRSVLKEYFQTGDKPTASQFGALIDSMVNRMDDRYLLGLKTYDTARVLRENTYSSSYWTKRERKNMYDWYMDMRK